jgi:cysteine dioxygenase
MGMDVVCSLCHCLGQKDVWTSEEIITLLQKFDCQLEQLESYIPQSPSKTEYGRKTLYRSKAVELILINFPVGYETPIHDHGESAGCCYVVSGSMINKCYEWIDGHSTVKPQVAKVEHIKEREFLYLPHKQIHSTYNPENKNLITLNAYFPPQENARTY